MASETDLNISRVLHAGYIFEFGKTKIIFDPIFESPFSGNCYSFPPVQFDTAQIKELSFDAIFISHYHDDHCSFESLNLVDRATPIYLHCIHEELFDLVRELGFQKVYQLKFNESVSVGDFVVKPWQPMDPDVDSMLQIKVAGLNILNVVDSVMDEDTLKSLVAEDRWDLVLWPFQTMRETAVLSPSQSERHQSEIPEDWIDDLRALSPRYIVPSACQFLQEPWSWYNSALFPISYQQFAKNLSANLPNSQVIRMNPGDSFILNEETLRAVESLSWVKAIGDQEVDYFYDPNLLPPPTSEIAMRFPALSVDELNRTLAFCETEILERYRSLEPTPFFSNSRFWQLSVYDNHGTESQFHFIIEGQSIDRVQLPFKCIDWITEVPFTKLFAALERGETLTSMYLRVVSATDVLEDPLIRTLFDGRFGAYQREQLRRIKSSAAELA